LRATKWRGNLISSSSPPLGYRDMLSLKMHTCFVITDSGGVQVEATVLGIPCLTVMDYPVWLITHREGTNTLVGSDSGKLADVVKQITLVHTGGRKHPALWDGKTAGRIISILTRR